MNKNKLIEECTIFSDAIVDYPFKDDIYKETAVLRHKSNKKWFGLIFHKDGELCINLKANPFDIAILKEQYPNFIKPAWHMNKKHWCTVIVNKTDIEVLKSLIKTSLDITSKKSKK